MFRLEDLLEDESISMVLEAMGGVDPGLSYAQACLRAGKHYITANKEAWIDTFQRTVAVQ